MNRRTLLMAVAGGGLTTFSGCLGSITGGGTEIKDSDGDGMIDSKDYAPKDPSVQEKSDISGGNSNGDTSTAESQQPKLQTDSTKKEREKILRLYNDGVGLANDGVTRLNSAISSFNNDRFDESISSAEAAVSKFENAESNFSKAVNICLRIGHEDALNLATDAQKYALHMQLAAQYGSMAAEAAKKGNSEQANNFVQLHREEYQKALELGVRDPPVLRDVLGL